MSTVGKKNSKVLSIPKFIAELQREALKNARANNLEIVLTPKYCEEKYKERYPNLDKASSAFRMALSRMGLDAEKREQQAKEIRLQLAQADIEEYQQVKDYVANAELGNVQQSQIKSQLTNIRKLWLIMGKTDPNSWNLTAILAAIRASGDYKEILNEQGVKVWEHPATIKSLLSPFSTMWKGKLPNNWSANLCVHKAGELKDFLKFHELAEFLSHIQDTEKMSKEGWLAMFTAHINMGCREGKNGVTGITGLLWQDIDFAAKRCSIREKGHRGNAGERWNLVPLDMFPYLHGWQALMKWHEQQDYPTIGNVFPVNYNDYNQEFHNVCKRCNNRLRNVDSDDCLRLHIFRREHGQLASRHDIPLELICGKAPNGRFGVGWKDPKIPVNYYLSEESEEIDLEELAFMQSHSEYAKVLKTMQARNQKIKELLGAF